MDTVLINDKFEESLESSLMDSFGLNDESAMDLEASGADNGTPCITLLATVTGFVEC